MDITTPSPEEARLSLDGHHYEEGMHLLVSLLNLADDAVIVRDPANRIVFWNLGAQRLYGWSAQEAMGQVTHDFLQTQFPESRDALGRFLASGEQWEGELVQTRKDGSQVIVESRQALRRTPEANCLPSWQ